MMRRVYLSLLFLLTGCLLFAACNYRPAPMQIIDDADEFELILQGDKEKADTPSSAQEPQAIPDAPPTGTTPTTPVSPEQETPDPAEEEEPEETEPDSTEDGEPGKAESDPAEEKEPEESESASTEEETGTGQPAFGSAGNTEEPLPEETEEAPTEETCKHLSWKWNEKIAPTCTETGVREHYHCPDCGKDFDKAGNLLSDLTIKETGHTFKDNQCKNCGIYRESKGLNISGNSVTGIGKCMDSRVVLPKSITQIETSAFDGCGFTEIVLHAGITRIGTGAFANCNSLQRIVFLGTKAEWNCINKEEYWNGELSFAVQCE